MLWKVEMAMRNQSVNVCERNVATNNLAVKTRSAAIVDTRQPSDGRPVCRARALEVANGDKND
jgi:hypothetical protein